MLFGDHFLEDLKLQIEKALSEAKDTANGKMFLLNTSLFDELISFVRRDKNAEDIDVVQQYIVNHNYRIDVEDLLTNKDKWMMEQNYRDFLIQILYNASISNKDKENFEKLMIEMFRTSVSDIEKSQIVGVTMKKIDIKNKEFAKKFYRFYNNLDDSKDGLIRIKTNGFFSEDTSNAYYKSKVQEKQEILSSILEGTKNIATSAQGNEIKAIFNEFDDTKDNFHEMQLRKVKIYLLLKTIKSEIYEKSDISVKKELIRNVLEKKCSDFKESILSTFCEKCDFGIITSFQNYSKDKKSLSTIDGLDIVKNISDDYGTIEKQKINEVFERINSFDNISFFEIKDSNDFADDCVYINNFISSNGKSNLLLCFRSNQKEQILSSIYANKNCYEKIANKKYDIDSASDIYSFAKICKDVDNDPMPSDNYKEVYNKYYLHESYKGIGGLSEDKQFSIKSDSNENFIRNDLSNNVISTNELLEILKIQAKSARPLHELKLTISDIKNLPAMIKKYYNFISYQMDTLCNKGLTPIDNLVIKNIDILSINEIKQLVGELDNSKVCFKLLKIDDPNVFDYVVENVAEETVQNNHIIYGKNDNFCHEINRERLKQKKDGDVFNSREAKLVYSKYSRISEDDFKIEDLNKLTVKSDPKEEFQVLSQEFEKRLKDNTGPNNEIELNVSVSTNVDKNIEFVMNMSKEPPSLDDLKENELISYDNVDEKMKDLLSAKSKRFSEKTKLFLLHVREKLKGSFKELFNEVTNRKYLSKTFRDVQFRDSNFYLTPEAFVSLMENFLYGGMTKFNGRIGDQKLSVFKICNGKKYVVGMTAKNINYDYINPIEEMFTFIPTNTVGLNREQLEKKYEKDISNIINNTGNIGEKIDSLGDNYGFLKNVLLNNALSSGLEYSKYISDNADEILSFLDYLSEKQDFVEICDSVCSNFCQTTQIGNVKLLFSLINPVNFTRGMRQVFTLIDNLKEHGFISDNFIKKLPNILNKNKYAIQVLYERLLKKKIDVEKIIIANRNYNSAEEKTSVDVNDIQDVERYFNQNKNALDRTEKYFSEYSFSGILYYNDINRGSKKFNYWNDVSYLDDCLESGGFLQNYVPADINIELNINVSKAQGLTGVKYRTENKDHDIYVDYLDLCYFLNKRHNRLSDGSIDEPNLSKEEEFLINNKIDILSNMNKLLETGDEVSKMKFYIVVKLYKDLINKKNYGLMPKVKDIFDNIDSDPESIQQLYTNIINNQDNAFLEYILMTGSDDEQVKKAKEVLLQELKKIKRKEVSYIQQGDNGKKYENKFAAKMFKLYCDTSKKGDFGFKEGQITACIENYSKEHERSSISCIKNICNDFDDEKNIKLYISFPDEMFSIFFNDNYAGKLLDNNRDAMVIDANLETFVKYCCAPDNYGKYSILCDKKRKYYENNDNSEAVKIFCGYLKKFNRQDTISVIEMANQCSIKGLDLIDLIKIIKNKKDINEQEMFRYIYVLQKIYLSSVQKSQSISLNNLSSVFDILKKVYFKEQNQKNDKNNDTLTYIVSQVERDIDYIVNILSSNVQKLSQKVRILEDNCGCRQCFSTFLENFSSLIYNCEKILKEEDEKQQIRFDKSSVEKIIAKAYSEYNEIIKKSKKESGTQDFNIIGKKFNRVNEKVNLFFSKINIMKMCYVDAMKKNDRTKQATMINLFGKALLLIQNYSIEDICLIFKIIGDDNLVTDSDILNKFSFIVEHIEEYRGQPTDNLYKQISDLYDLSKGEKYLNTGLKHKDLMKILARIKTQNNDTKNVINSLKIVKDQIMKDFKNNVSNNGGFLKNNIIDRVDGALLKVVNGCSDLIDKLYNKDDGRATLEKVNKILSQKDAPIEILFKNESILLLEENIADMQAVTSLINNMFSQLMQDQGTVEIILADYEDKMKKKQQISDIDRLKFIAAFLVKHTREQNKTLRWHQLTAIMLENFQALNSALSLNDEENLRNINLIQTGGGKSLTILFGLFAMFDLTAFAVTTNMLLVNEMMNDAEKNSLYKNHIFYLDDNQNLIEKSTNRKVPITEILEILKDKRNKFFTTYKDLSFWRQKLLRERSGLEIVEYLENHGCLFLDEVDSVINAKTSNKISMSCSVDIKKYNVALYMQKLYDVLSKKGDIGNFKSIIENFDPKNSTSSNKEELEFISEIIKNTKPELEKIPSFNDLDDGSKAYIMKMAIACFDANRMKDGVEYTITTNAETGSTTILPITGGEPDESGSRFDPLTSMALKVKLKLNNGCHFDDMLVNTMIVSEGNNAAVVDYFKKSFGFSGTIYGAKEIWGKKGFKVRNIKTMSVPNIKKLDLPCSITDDNNKNPVLDFIFLCSALSIKNNLSTCREYLKEKIYKMAKEYFADEIRIGIEQSSYEGFVDLIINNIQQAPKDSYFLTFMRDSNELEAFQKRLKKNLDEAKEYFKQKKVNFNCPEIMVLDKKQYLLDDQVIKSKLGNNEDNNCFVFALQDRARGFDFPGFPTVLNQGGDSKEGTRQKLGRTGRNGKPGTIINAYAIKQEDIYLSKYKLNLKDKHENYSSYYSFYMNQIVLQDEKAEETSNLLKEIAQKAEDERSKRSVKDFIEKDHYYKLITFVSSAMSIFLNIATKNLDNDTRDKVFDASNQICGNFIEMIDKKFKNLQKMEDHERLLQSFTNSVYRSDLEEICKLLYNKCCVFPNNSERQSFHELFKKMLETYDKLSARQYEEVRSNLEDSKYRDIDPLEAYNKMNEAVFKENNYKLNNDQRFTNISQNKQECLYTSLGCADACGYSLNLSYSIENNNTIRILKKKIFDSSSAPFSYKERCIVLLDAGYLRDISSILNSDKVKKILSTLPNDFLLIASSRCDDFNSTFCIQQSSQANVDNVLYNNFEYNKSTNLVAEAIKKFTEDGTFDARYINDFGKKYGEEFKNKVSNIESVDYYLLLNNDTVNKYIGYVERGLKKDEQKTSIEFTDEIETKAETNYTDFLKNIVELSKFSLEPSKDDFKKIIAGEKSLLFFLDKKIMSFVGQIRKLKDDIENCDEIEYIRKVELMKEINKLDSKDNIIELLKRAMQNVAFSSHIQETLNEFDVLKGEINIDNVDGPEIELQKLIDSTKNSEDFADSVKNSNINEDVHLKKTLYSGYNDIVSNINYARNKLDKIKLYKKELEFIKDNESFFNGFSEKEMVITSDKINNCIENYKNIMNNINAENKDFFSERQKEQLRDDAINKNINNAINMSFNKINKVLNEFTLTYKDDADFSDIGINKRDIALINNIKKLYIKTFKKISKNDGFDWLEIIKEMYDKEDVVDYDDEEDVKKNIKNKYDADLASFKDEVKTLLLGYQNDIITDSKENVSDVERKLQLPIVAYNFFEKMFKFLQKNYKENSKAHNKVKKEIITTIVSVFNVIKSNIYNIHDQFKDELSALLQKNIPEFTIDSFNITNETINELDQAFDKLDIATLRDIQKDLSGLVSADMSKTKEAIKKMEANINEPNVAMKIVYIICTLGLILFTKNGKNMFKKKEIIKENIKLKEDIKPKLYFVKNSKKQKDINNTLSTLSVSIDNVDVVDIDNIGKDNKQITNNVQDSLNTSYNSINLT